MEALLSHRQPRSNLVERTCLPPKRYLRNLHAPFKKHMPLVDILSNQPGTIREEQKKRQPYVNGSNDSYGKPDLRVCVCG